MRVLESVLFLAIVPNNGVQSKGVPASTVRPYSHALFFHSISIPTVTHTSQSHIMEKDDFMINLCLDY